MARRARQHDVVLALDDKALIDAIALDDCLTTVLLFEYAKQHELNKVNAAVKKRANDIKTADAREKDKNWLLIYQVWSETVLEGNGQPFLAKLKGLAFEFFIVPTAVKAPPATVVKVVSATPQAQATGHRPQVLCHETTLKVIGGVQARN